MLSATLRASILFVSACLAYSQTEPSITFDAASVKPSAPPSGNFIVLGRPTGGPGTPDPGRIHYPNMSMKSLLITAYDVKSYQITGPPWLDTERFDIDATMPPSTTKDQFHSMLRNLLADRFQLVIHRETKDLPVYTMTVNKGGPKMKESSDTPAKTETDAPALTTLPSQPKLGPDGFPLPPSMPGGGLFMMIMPGRARIVSQERTVQDLTDRLSGLMNRPVTDATGLKAKYDFLLTFSLDGLDFAGPMGPPPPPPGAHGDNVFVPDGETPQDLFSAVQSQLGLRLDAKKGPVVLIVVDKIEKTPTGN